MKLIKKAPQTQPQASLRVEVGDLIVVQPPSSPDGRGGWDTPSKIDMTVLKVHKVTFDAEDLKGNVYRLDIREDKFQVKNYQPGLNWQ